MKSVTRGARGVISRCALASLVASCGGPPGTAAPPPAARAARPAVAPSTAVAALAAAVPEPPPATLDVVPRRMTEHPDPLQARVVDCDRRGELETLQLEVPLEPYPREDFDTVRVADGAAFFGDDVRPSETGRTVFVRRWLSAGAKVAISADVYVSGGAVAYRRDAAAHHYLLALPEPVPRCARKPALERAFHSAALRDPALREGAFGRFLQRKLSAPGGAARGGAAAGPWVDMMSRWSGREGVQQALQLDRKVVTDGMRAPRRVAVATVEAAASPAVPFQRLLAALPAAAVDEPLAACVPAEFYFVRARHLAPLLDALEAFQDWGQPLSDLLDGRALERGVAARYETELGVAMAGLGRVLGPQIVEGVALAGSDPFLDEGTDVTVLLQVRQPALFDAALAVMMAPHAAAHSGVVATAFTHEGVPVRVLTSKDGRVRQHRASVNGVELLSNSGGAIRRVISAALGRAPRLGNEQDFRYLVARDAGVEDELFAFAGQAFVTSVVGPARAIGEARRQLALAELSAPGFARLAYGILHGRPAASDADLMKAGLLSRADLRHFDGAPLTLTADGARSRYGTPAALEPLIDLPPVTTVTADERAAYGEFARRYRDLWADFVDPVAVRVAKVHDGVHAVHVREVPMLPRQDQELRAFAGDARVTARPLRAGLRVALGFGKDASLRRELLRETRRAGLPIDVDWLGDVVVVGTEDRSELTHVVSALPDVREIGGRRKDDSEMFAALRNLPIYVDVGLRSRAAAVVALAALKRSVEDVAPGITRWRDAGEYRGVPIVTVRVAEREDVEPVELTYALAPDAFLASLNAEVVRHLVDAHLDGAAPVAAKPGSDPGGQLLAELTLQRPGTLATLASWVALTERLRASEASANLAEVLLRGDPASRAGEEAFRSRAAALFGGTPLTADGLIFADAPEGARDPRRGTRVAPEIPPFSLETPLQRAIARLASLRAEVAFETEPGAAPDRPVRSLRARLTLGVSR